MLRPFHKSSLRAFLGKTGILQVTYYRIKGQLLKIRKLKNMFGRKMMIVPINHHRSAVTFATLKLGSLHLLPHTLLA